MAVVTKGQAIGFVVISLLQLAVGIVGIVLSKYLFDAIEDSGTFSLPTIRINAWWIFGLPYLVPPIFGFLAAGLRNTGMVAAYMTFNIIAMVVSGVFTVIFIMFLAAVAAIDGITCVPVELGTIILCSCRAGLANSVVADPTGVCDSANTGIDMLYGVAAMVIIGWVLCLVGSILCCASCCCTQDRTPGVVYAQESPGYAMSTPSHAYHQEYQPQVKNANYRY